jgi:hypothetical protein
MSRPGMEAERDTEMKQKKKDQGLTAPRVPVAPNNLRAQMTQAMP